MDTEGNFELNLNDDIEQIGGAYEPALDAYFSAANRMANFTFGICVVAAIIVIMMLIIPAERTAERKEFETKYTFMKWPATARDMAANGLNKLIN